MHCHSSIKGFLYGFVGLSVHRSARPIHEIVFHIQTTITPFLTPHCASNWALGPHMDLNLEVYYLSGISQKNGLVLLMLLIFVSFMVIFSQF